MDREIWLVIFTSAMPILELRGGIPLGISIGLPISKAFCGAVIGNLLPVLPLLFLLEPISNRFRKTKMCAKFFAWLFIRTKKRADIVERYEALGLMLLVAIPLPMTGVWTGCIAASLFKIRLSYSLLAIVSGVIIAGLLVSIMAMAAIGCISG